MKSIFQGIAAAAAVTLGIAAAQGAFANQGETKPSAPAALRDDGGAIQVSQNDNKPEKGANSFTQDQAKTRIEKNGFKNVTDLHIDSDGVWHGRAEKDGRQVSVWLDYKGRVGTS
jgi:periplasmic protein CpxP/Spy